MLNPVFSTNHMRHMLPVFYDVVFRVRVRFAEAVSYETHAP